VKTVFTLLLLCCFGSVTSRAADPSPEDKAMVAKFEKELAELNTAMAAGKPSLAQYSRRGDLNFFLMKFEEAVADYQKMNDLDPTQEERHWRLGIAYYVSGDLQKSVDLFEKYYKHDNTDRETGLWHFLGNAGLSDIPTAQSKMLKYDKDDRPPFKQLYDFFGGEGGTVQEFFRALYDEGFSTKQDVMFYARLYSGIYEEVSGRPETAEKFIRMAYESPWGRKAIGGPGYMWQIARILATAPKEEEKPAEEKKPDGEKKPEGEGEKKPEAEKKPAAEEKK
jgi:tetratricopeptide (TPR) repeat protein